MENKINVYKMGCEFATWIHLSQVERCEHGNELSMVIKCWKTFD
jgi:hypothetical protein